MRFCPDRRQSPEPLFKVESSLDEWLGSLHNRGFFDFALLEIPDRSPNYPRGLLGRRSQQMIHFCISEHACVRVVRCFDK